MGFLAVMGIWDGIDRGWFRSQAPLVFSDKGCFWVALYALDVQGREMLFGWKEDGRLPLL
jgi:hypothetical protein